MPEQDQNTVNRIAANKMFIYFSELIDKPVWDSNNYLAGQIYDIVLKPSAVYPQSASLVIRKGFPNRKYAVVSWEQVKDIDIYSREASLNIARQKLVFEEKRDNKDELTLRRDILDQQVVDTHNHKVIRINDIHLLFVEQALMVAHVDISTRGLIRRLGFEKIVDFLVNLVAKDAAYLKTEHLISWKYIQPLSINPASMTIKVNVPEKQFSSIPAADLGEIFLDLNIKQQLTFFRSLDAKTQARVFTHINFKTQKSLVEDLQPKQVAELLSNIPSDEATDFLEKLPKDMAEHLLSFIETKYAKKLSQLLGYSSDSAGGLMTAEYTVFIKDTPVESALKQIKERVYKVEPAQYVYIVDENNRLLGTTNFRRLILADPREPIQNVAFPKTYSVHLNSSVKEVAYLMEKYKYYTIPVVDAHHVLQGIITVDDILSQLIAFAWRRLKKIKMLSKNP
ncbi:MAG: CBS domain-containing protein [Candidatus Omnitrophica bacterium]|nr:CBS domain-containing protein [Candidatus Omnitrophota bacterium]